MKHRPHIATSIAAVAKANGWKRQSLTSGERFTINDQCVVVHYAADGRVRSAFYYYGPSGDRVKGGRWEIEALLRRMGNLPGDAS